MYYGALIFVAIFTQLLLILAIQGNEMLSRVKKRLFIGTCFLLIFATFFEWLGVTLNGAAPWTKKIHLIVKVLEFSLAPMIVAGCVASVQRKFTLKKIYALAIIHLFIELICMPFQLIVSINSDNIYVRGDLYPLYIVFYLTALISLCYENLKLNIEYQIRNQVYLYVWTLFIICCTTIQTVYSEIRIDWLCVGISNLMFYMNYNNIIHHVDGLTKLLNRSCFQNNLDTLNKPVMVQYIDVDKFKIINDTFGHNFGDEVLAKVGKVINQIYGKVGRCYRIGGDEFCVIIDYQKYSLEKANKEFLELWEDERQKSKNLPTVSMGAALFDPKKDYALDVMERADKAMYHNKRKNQL